LKFENEKTVINDKWIFIFVYPIFVIFVCHVGNDNSFSYLLTLPSYYTDILLAIICTYSAGFYWKYIFEKLDRRFDWYSNLKELLIYQLIFGFIVPIIIITGVEIVYLLLIDIKLSASSIFYLELPMIAILSLLVNLGYLFLYNRSNLMVLMNIDKPINFSENFVVKSGNVAESIALGDVAYFVILEKITFLISIHGKRHIYDFTLDEIIDKVSPKEFFQLNRQVIARKNSIVRCKQTETRRLEITLSPPLPKPLFVAKTKSTKLLSWLNQN
jgi:hypothetical protein